MRIHTGVHTGVHWLAATFIVLFASISAFAQGGSITRQVISPTVANGGTGQPASYALIRVCQAAASGTPCSPLVPNVYQDQALTEPLPAAFAADVNGIYNVFVPTGEYLVQESNAIGAGYTFNYSYLAFVNGTGTVSVIQLTVPTSVFNLSGSPCTGGLCNFILSLIGQSSNTVFANCNGTSTAIPAFCPLTAAMIPSTLGPTTIAGNLTVNGNDTINGNDSITGTLSVTGLSSLAGVAASSLTLTGNASIGGTLGVTGDTTLSGMLTTIGASSFTSITNSGTLAVTGSSTFSGSVVVGGTVFVTGSTTSITGTGLTSPIVNATTGFQINGSYGSTGQCLQSTGTGTIYGGSCSLGGTPAITAGTGAGTGSTVSLASGSLDKTGAITVITGTSPTAGVSIATITFSTPFATTAFCGISAANSNASGVNVYASRGFSPASQFIVASETGSALSAGTTYQWTYNCGAY